MIPNILTIAGSDSSGGAGIQADLKAISALECYGMSVITALTAQNTRGVTSIHEAPPAFVRDQLLAVFDDVRVDAVKIGMVGNPDIIDIIVKVLQQYKPTYVIVDPVMVSETGARLADDPTIDSIRNFLAPMATILTPNLPEAQVLLGCEFDGDMGRFAKDLLRLESGAVLLKGGHAEGEDSIDVYADRNGIYELSEKRIPTRNTHGTGCTLASAVASYLARGLPQLEACMAAKKYVTAGLRYSDELDVGQGAGPLHHFYAHWRRPKDISS